MKIRECLITACALLCVSAPAFAQMAGAPPAVQAVLGWKFDPSTPQAAEDKMMASIVSFYAYLKSQGGPCTGQTLRATLAGSDTGGFVSITSCPNMAAYVAMQDKQRNDPGFQKAFGDIVTKAQAAKATVVFSSLYEVVLTE
jgi:hypothetical protein